MVDNLLNKSNTMVDNLLNKSNTMVDNLLNKSNTMECSYIVIILHSPIHHDNNSFLYHKHYKEGNNLLPFNMVI